MSDVRSITQSDALDVGTTRVDSQRVLRNTYALLSLTLMFSALCAGVSMKMGMPPLGLLITLVGAYGLMFAIHALRNSVWSLPLTFAFTGLLGANLGPLLNAYMSTANGASLVMTAAGGTGAVFLALSAFTLITRKNFSFLSNFLFVGAIVLILAMVAGIFIELPALHLGISAMFVLFASASILYTTSGIIHGGETNYVLATVSLYVSIYNLFVSLLQLLGFAGGDE